MAETPRIVSLATAVPPARYPQEVILEHLAGHFEFYRSPRVRAIFLNADIDSRHLALPAERFRADNSAGELHAVFREFAPPLGREAAELALCRAGLGPRDVDLIVVATCTGYLCPGLSARLAAELGMADHVQRADLVGMGCAGAMPALQRAHDFVRAYPDKRALVVTVEVSSACWFVDETLETVVGNTICADGAAAAVVAAGGGAGPKLERFATLLDSRYLESVGFSFEEGKNRIVLAGSLRHDAGPMVKQAVERLLDGGSAPADEMQHWVVHAGGRKVLDGIGESLGFRNGELRHSREILRTHGNMSSPTVLFVLEQTMQTAQPGERGVMIALGPGLAAETALLQW